MRALAAVAAGLWTLSTAAAAEGASTSQDLASGVADTVRLAAGGPETAPPLEAGEQVAAWVEGEVRAVEAGVARRPIGDAAPGEVIARFAGSGWFAWPRGRTVWTAPRAGELRFGLNGRPEEGLRGEAQVILVRLGPPGSAVRCGFPPPTISIERAADEIRVRYADRAGFGLDRKSLRFTLTTAHGEVISIAPWVAPFERETILPLPPPGVPLPGGIHALRATITDRIGNDAPPARIDFDSARQED